MKKFSFILLFPILCSALSYEEVRKYDNETIRLLLYRDLLDAYHNDNSFNNAYILLDATVKSEYLTREHRNQIFYDLLAHYDLSLDSKYKLAKLLQEYDYDDYNLKGSVNYE